MTTKNRITVNLTTAEYEALSELADQFQVSMAWLGRRAIADLIEKYRKAPDQMPLPFFFTLDEAEKSTP